MKNENVRNERFTILCNLKERRLISIVAKQLDRSQADTIRLLTRTAAQELHITSDDLANNDRDRG